MKSADAGIRQRSAFALARLGAPARAAVPDLIAALGDSDEETRLQASWCLQALDADGLEALAALKPLLKSAKVEDRRFAMGFLAEAGPAAEPFIIEALPDDDPEVCSLAIKGLVQGRGNDPKLIPLLFRAAARPVVLAGPWNAAMLAARLSVKDATILVEQAHHTDPAIRALACESLGIASQRVDPASDISRKQIVPTLRQALKDPEPSVRLRALYAVQSLRFPPEELAAAALSLLESQEPRIRQQAFLFGGGTPGKDNGAAVAAMTKALKDSDKQVRYKAALRLTDLNARDKEVLAILLELLGDKDFYMERSSCCTALSRFGAEARGRSHAQAAGGRPQRSIANQGPGGPEEDRPVGRRRAAASGVRRPPPAALPLLKDDEVPGLVKELEDEQLDVRMNAAYRLAMAGKEGKATVPVLMEGLKAPAAQTRLRLDPGPGPGPR